MITATYFFGVSLCLDGRNEIEIFSEIQGNHAKMVDWARNTYSFHAAIKEFVFSSIIEICLFLDFCFLILIENASFQNRC